MGGGRWGTVCQLVLNDGHWMIIILAYHACCVSSRFLCFDHWSKQKPGLKATGSLTALQLIRILSAVLAGQRRMICRLGGRHNYHPMSIYMDNNDCQHIDGIFFTSDGFLSKTNPNAEQSKKATGLAGASQEVSQTMCVSGKGQHECWHTRKST